MTNCPTVGRRSSRMLVAALSLAVGAAWLAAPARAHAAPATITGELNAKETNDSLETLARGLASALNRADVRTVIQKSVEKRFDGDDDALWSSLVSDPVFYRRLADEVDLGVATRMPRLQVAVPAHFASWNPMTYRPLVAYVPEGLDDTKMTTITAYDAAGRTVTLDTGWEPRQPVIVLGLNERTDPRGVLRAEWRGDAQQNLSVQSPAAAGKAAARKYSVDVETVELVDDMEPWVKGDAEISMKARSKGCSGTDYQDSNWTALNNNGDYWNGHRNMGTTTCDVAFYWWEDDGGVFDYTLGIDGFSLGVAMDDDDDLIGHKILPHSSFAGSTEEFTVWSGLTMSTE